jgi:ABC-type branched-subunit amino acid transport system ATPase component/ABC-type branched-subunit amino acid transport system permease subunit
MSDAKLKSGRFPQLPANPALRRGLWPAVLLVAALVPLMVSDYNLYLLQGVLVYGLIAVGLNILIGYSGQVSLGHAGFLAIGGYSTALIVAELSLPVPVALLLAAAGSGLVGWLLGWAAARLSGHYLAIATLAFAIIVQRLLYELSITGGRNGLAVPTPELFGLDMSSSGNQYWLALVVVLIAMLFTTAVARSRVGRAWIALKNSDISASSCGVDVGAYRVKAFALSAWLTGLAGGLFAFQVSYLSADAFTLNLSLAFLIAVVVGGMGSLVGSLIGGAFLVIVPQVLSEQAEAQQVFYGAAIVLVVLLLPRGLVQLADLVRRGRGTAEQEASADDIGRPPASWTRHSTPVLSVEHVGINFNGVQALRDVSFQVEPGEIVGLVGPNGAGKTTALNLISGYYRANEGRIRLGERDLTDLRTHQMRAQGVGRSFQQALLFDDLTVLENLLVGGHSQVTAGVIQTGLAMPGSRRAEQRLLAQAREVLALVGLTHRQDVKARELAFGERKLVDFARSVMGNPQLLLLDEPAAGLNTVETERLREVIATVNGTTGCSVLLIEHDMELVLALCHRLVVLDFGTCIAAGDPDLVRNDPKVVEAYMGMSVDAKN